MGSNDDENTPMMESESEQSEKKEEKKPDPVRDDDPRLRTPNLAEVGVKAEEIDEKGQYYYKEDGYDDSEARDENFFWSICLCICPTISWKQFIVWVSLFEILVFIISCSIYGVSNEAFLAPNPHALAILGW